MEASSFFPEGPCFSLELADLNASPSLVAIMQPSNRAAWFPACRWRGTSVSHGGLVLWHEGFLGQFYESMLYDLERWTRLPHSKIQFLRRLTVRPFNQAMNVLHMVLGVSISVCPEKPRRLSLSHHYNEANKQE